MTQIKVSEIASRINKKPLETLKLLIVKGFAVKSESSILEESDVADFIKENTLSPGEASISTADGVVQKRISKRIIRRRRSTPAPKPVEEEIEVVEKKPELKPVKKLEKKPDEKKVPEKIVAKEDPKKQETKEPLAKEKAPEVKKPAPPPKITFQAPKIRIIKPAPPNSNRQTAAKKQGGGTQGKGPNSPAGTSQNRGGGSPNSGGGNNYSGSERSKPRRGGFNPRQHTANKEEVIGLDAREVVKQMQERLRASKQNRYGNRNQNQYYQQNQDANLNYQVQHCSVSSFVL